MTPLPIYAYRDVRAFLLEELQLRQKSHPAFSVRTWAQDMGLRSHSLLVLLLQGKRPLRLQHAEFLLKGLKLTTAEALYLRALIQLANARSPEERRLCELWLAELNPGATFESREIDEYAVVAHWIHSAILTLAELPNFTADATELHRRFRGKVSVHEIRSALLRLEKMGLLKRTEDESVTPAQSMVSTRDDHAMAAVQEHLKQVTRLAESAIAEQGIFEREFQAFSVTAQSSQIPLVKEMMRRFKMQIVQALRADRLGETATEPSEVYQMNLQFFRLTESPAKVTRLSSEDEAAAKRKTPRVSAPSERKIPNALS